MTNQTTKGFLFEKLQTLKNEILEIGTTDKILNANVLHALVYANLKTATEMEEKNEDEQGHGVRLFTQHMVKYCLRLVEADEQEREVVITDKMHKLLEVAHIHAPTYASFFVSSLNAIHEAIESIDDETELNVLQHYLITLIANVTCVQKAVEQEEFYTEA